jgi:non-ribosomal peptide synthetase component E (peptide arylation enzyme)
MLLQVPSRVKAMDAIPRNAMGKVNKKTLVAVFDDPSP